MTCIMVTYPVLYCITRVGNVGHSREVRDKGAPAGGKAEWNFI